MPVRFDRSGVPGIIRLEGNVDIECATELKGYLAEAVGAGAETRISLEELAGIDVTAIQLLWAAEREAKATGALLTLEEPIPEGLRVVLRGAGFGRLPFDDGKPTDEVQ